MLGNDYQGDQWKTYDPFVVALSEGIREPPIPTKLQTIELNYRHVDVVRQPDVARAHRRGDRVYLLSHL